MNASYVISDMLLANGYRAKAFNYYITNIKLWAMAAIFAGVTYFIFPELQLCWWLYGLMVLDFITAYIRERANGRQFTFAKMRDSVSKTIQYTAFLLLLWCLVNIAGVRKLEGMIAAMNSAYVFLIIIESKSIGENIRDISPDSNFSKYVLGPFLGLIETVIKKKSASIEKQDITKI